MEKQSTPRWVFFAILFLFAATAQSQTLKDFFSNEGANAFFVDIDFTKNKLIDVPDANTSDIRDRQYEGLNTLVVTEEKKYNLKSAFHRSNAVDHDLSLVRLIH